MSESSSRGRARVGVDYFRPFWKSSAEAEQWRGTAVAIHALQMEVAPPLDTDAFIKAHRDSVARSGHVLDLCCGNVVEQPPRSWKQFQNIDERMMKLLISFFLTLGWVIRICEESLLSPSWSCKTWIKRVFTMFYVKLNIWIKHYWLKAFSYLMKNWGG